MRRINIVIIIIYLFCGDLVFGKELSKYSFVKVKDIPSGKEEGMIGWQEPIAGSHSGPTAIAISDDNKIYIPDRVNYRINVYDINFNYIKTIIEEKKEVHFAHSLKLDNDNNIIANITGTGLKKINQKGVLIFFKAWETLPKNVRHRHNYFPLNNEIFINNDQDEVEYITKSGKNEKVSKASIRLQELTRYKKKQQNVSINKIKIPDSKKQVIENLRVSNKFLLIDDNYYCTNFYNNKKYFEKVKDIRDYVITKKLKKQGLKKKNKITVNLDNFSHKFIGYDNEHNSYWDGTQDMVKNVENLAIIIYSKYGELLDVFYYGQYSDYENSVPNLKLYSTPEAVIAVSPAGDVYFLVGSRKKYTLYKVKCQW